MAILGWGGGTRRGLNFQPNCYNFGLDSVSEMLSLLHEFPFSVWKVRHCFTWWGEKSMELIDPQGRFKLKTNSSIFCSWMCLWELEPTSETSGFWDMRPLELRGLTHLGLADESQPGCTPENAGVGPLICAGGFQEQKETTRSQNQDIYATTR